MKLSYLATQLLGGEEESKITERVSISVARFRPSNLYTLRVTIAAYLQDGCHQ